MGRGQRNARGQQATTYLAAWGRAHCIQGAVLPKGQFDGGAIDTRQQIAQLQVAHRHNLYKKKGTTNELAKQLYTEAQEASVSAPDERHARHNAITQGACPLHAPGAVLGAAAQQQHHSIEGGRCQHLRRCILTTVRVAPQM